MADIWDTPPRAELDSIVVASGVPVGEVPWLATAAAPQATAQSNVIAARRRAVRCVGPYGRDERDCIAIMAKFPRVLDGCR
jgi:hypothetical protein